MNGFVFPMRRDNLNLYIKLMGTTAKVHRRESLELNRFHSVERELDAWNGKGAAILYCPTVKMVEKLYCWLKACHYQVCIYHGKISRKKREEEQQRFMSGQRPIMIATNAFGLGIDKPDVRLIIHVGLPLSLDGYVQEIGRAGRDGKNSRCVLFYAKSDFSTNERVLRKGNIDTFHIKRKRLNALKDLLDSDDCMWRIIEKYFGQKKDNACGHCCNCLYKR